MRSSSVKTLVSAVSLTFTLIVAAPSAEARPAQPQRPSASAPSMTDRVQRVMRQWLHRVMGITAQIMPTDPVPAARFGETTQSIMPTDPVPVENP